MRASLVWGFFAYKKILGRTETRTRDRMYFGRIRSVRDISRGDRARIGTCSLRTPTDLRQIIVKISAGEFIFFNLSLNFCVSLVSTASINHAWYKYEFIIRAYNGPI